MGEFGHRSCSEHVPTDILVQMVQGTEDATERPVVSAFLTGARHLQGYDENGQRSQNGRRTGVHKVLCSPKDIKFSMSDPTMSSCLHSNIGKGMKIHVGRLVNWYGRQELIFIEDSLFNFYLNRELKSTENNSVNKSQRSGNEHGRSVCS